VGVGVAEVAMVEEEVVDEIIVEGLMKRTPLEVTSLVDELAF